jgi:TolB-like protein/tetratricopeptide (TPR) repeat protein
VDLAAWFQELRRRRVIRALLGWGLLSFAVLQVIEPVMHALDLKDWVLRIVVGVLAAGFPVAAILSWFFDLGAGGVSRTPDEGPVEPDARARPGRGALVAVVVVSALAGAGLAVASLRMMDREPSAAPSVAVLPFADMSQHHDQEYFADGVAEEILNALAQVQGLTVIGRTSSFSFKGKNEDLRTIGQKLGVATILEGSVRKQGDKIRITAQLIRTADGSHLWSQAFDRDLADVLAVQADVARGVARALRPRLASGGATIRTERRPANPEAYRLYLLSRELSRRSGLHQDRKVRALETIQSSLALDPGFAPAWASLASQELALAGIAATQEASEAGRGRARAAADRAIALDPEDPLSYAARAAVSYANLDTAAGNADRKTAIGLSAPGSAPAHHMAGNYFVQVGQFQEALHEYQKVVELDPLARFGWLGLGRVRLRLGDLGGARQAIERARDQDPDLFHEYMGTVLLLEGKPSEALAAFERVPAEPVRLSLRAIAHHSLGDRTGSDEALRTLTERFDGNFAYQIAEAHAWRGESNAALEWLERALRQRDFGLYSIPVSAWLASLRGDPRFIAFVQKVGLPPEVARK